MRASRILIADDAATRASVRELLGPPHEYVEADSATRALEVLRAGPPFGLLVVGTELPEGALRLIEAIREDPVLRGMPSILLANDDGTLASSWLDVGAVLSKPVSRSRLTKTVAVLLRKTATERIRRLASEAVAIDDAFRDARRLGPEGFQATYPWPALIVKASKEARADAPEERPSIVEKSGTRPPTEPDPSFGELSKRIFFVRKRAGNAFPKTITVGRSSENDVVIPAGAVSKFHGSFTTEEGAWFFQDHGSRNGSTLNGTRLAMGVATRLSSKDAIGLGASLVATFLEPRDLFDAVLVARLQGDS